ARSAPSGASSGRSRRKREPRAPFALTETDDDLLARAGGLPLPCLGDPVERERLDRDLDPASRRMADELEVALAQRLDREAEVREAEQVDLLATHDGGAERRLRARRLADVDDPGAGRRRGQRRGERPVPERIDDDRRAVA